MKKFSRNNDNRFRYLRNLEINFRSHSTNNRNYYNIFHYYINLRRRNIKISFRYFLFKIHFHDNRRYSH